VILDCPDWKIIPVENLIAETYGKTKLLAKVKDFKEAKLAFETLELGVDGVVINTSDPKEVVKTVSSALTVKTRKNEKHNSKIDLSLATISSLKQLGIGTRACIDTCDIMTEGEGMLVGCQSSGLFLVHAEVGTDLKSDPRPFRVNAGAVSLYILTPGNRTRYVSELSAGEEVLIVDKQGNTRSTIIGRVKIEKRPMIIIEAEIDEKTFKTILQNAETIRLISPEGPKSVTELNIGDNILVQRQHGGRHFGVLVEEESVIEK
jgi:3-dehydroquinate synthase II